MRGGAGGCWGCGGMPGRARVRAGRWKGDDPPPPHSAAGCALKVAFFSGALPQLRWCGGSEPVALFKCVSIASLVMTSSQARRGAVVNRNPKCRNVLMYYVCKDSAAPAHARFGSVPGFNWY